MPSWLALFAPLPADVTVERKPVASAQQIASGTAGPIAGWQSLSIHLNAPEGMRHILVTVDETGKVLSAGDHVMRVSLQQAKTTTYDHESVGGRYEDDGSFRGTRWFTRMEQNEGEDDARPVSSTPSSPSAEDTAALKEVVVEVMKRSPR